MNIKLILLFCILLNSCSAPPPSAITISGQTMGTTYSVKINGTVKKPAQLKERIDAELDRINSLMSTYDPESEISRFNRSTSTEWFGFSTDTIRVLQASQDIAKKSGGAFDITIGQLVNLWGFGPDGQVDIAPSKTSIDKIKKNIGFWQLVVEASPKRARKIHPELAIDLSAIAKGFGVDKLAELLAKKGFYNYMVEVGGEIRALGSRPNGTPWQIALEKPVASKRVINTVVSVSNQAIATSGSYRNYYEKDGIRYSHTINPQSGKPISHNLVSVSVVHESCMMADAWATTLMVLGAEQGKLLANKYKIKALFTTKGSSEFDFKQEESDAWSL